MNQKRYQSIYGGNVNANLMVENVDQLKSGTTMNVGASIKIRKNIVCSKNITFGISLHLMVNNGK